MKTLRIIGQLTFTFMVIGMLSCSDNCSESSKSGESPEVPNLYRISTLQFLDQAGNIQNYTGPNLQTETDYISDYSGGCGTTVNLKSHHCWYFGASNFSWKNSAEFKDEVLYGFSRIQFGDYSFTVYPNVPVNLRSDENIRYIKYPSLTLRGKVHNMVTEIRTTTWHYVSTYREDSAAIYMCGDTILRFVDYGTGTLLDFIQ